MDTTELKSALLSALEDDVSFRHQVLNLLRSDLNEMIKVDVSRPDYDEPVSDVDLYVNRIDDDTTKEEILQAINYNIHHDFKGAFSHFPQRRRKREASSRKLYIDYVKAQMKHVEAAVLKDFYQDFTLRISALAQNIAADETISAYDFFTNLELGEYDKALTEQVV